MSQFVADVRDALKLDSVKANHVVIKKPDLDNETFNQILRVLKSQVIF